MHYSKRYKKRIAQLECELEMYKKVAIAAEANSKQNLILFKEEQRKRQNLESELEKQKRLNTDLQAKSCLWEREGKNLHAELKKMGELSDAYADSLKKIKALEKKLNIRKGTEDPYGLNTPSSKKVNKPNSTAENRAKRGGAKPGHEGHGRKDFTVAEADQVTYNSVPSGRPCCDNPDLHPVGTVNHAVYNFVPMKLEKVMNVNTKYHCVNCDSDVLAAAEDTFPGAKYSNMAGALSIAECYFHNATIGSVAERFGINKGTLIGIAHRYADALEPLYRQIIFEMRKSLFLHADETGWSMDGKKAYAWLFANDLFQVFAFRETRGSIVPKEILGEEESELILIVDRYRGYSPLLLFRQFCYAHLFRDVEELKLEFPDDKQVTVFCDDLMNQLTKAMKLKSESLSRQKYVSKARKIKKEIMRICHEEANDPGVQGIQDIFRENEDKLFHWVENPDIPCENNFGERNLRPVVILRKISFGCQSERGMRTREILMTILHTAKCRGHDPVNFLERALNILCKDPKADLRHLIFSDELSNSQDDSIAA
ncbi:MAG: IS66 family transposase [Victivallaceae bacterium]|nr:IS66 family transposase [Victivallaceae bacterium]